ncbi:ARM repeat-containing protein [Dichomitus squalens LYAD-421 SS1]|uniref:ARM repeat-containing protein n=1 Tax=Dichomitus squalens (strain LYAD-421) TaxID=732165 RepID=UPI0004415004|nr:ARM repeat-containing protein [Dichomitus squalens LYAD-421 SS1]EJF66455.1 ARM repeat-containing protein [Dichomitus squalens LYAD-421 SS1]
MDDDDVSVPDSPSSESGTFSPDALERQRASLQSYLNQLPYECEAPEEMQAKLEHIVGRICVCAETKNWLVLTTWDGMLQCWLLMRYPMPKPTRAKLTRLYYELCLIPGIEPRVMRSWADMLSRLICNKPDSRRKLDTADLQLPWRPLWRVLQKELWPKKRMHDSSRNVVNILLFVAEQCKRYYTASEIPDMLSTFLPILTKDTVLTMVPVLTSFIPPTHTHVYLPTVFKLWEAFNSSLIDDRFVELCGELAEEHIAGQLGDAGPEGAAEWKTVGIWSEAEWTFLIGKALGSMNVPVGATRGASTTAGHADTMADKQSLRIKKLINRSSALAKLIVYSLSLDSSVRPDSGSAPGTPSSEGYLAGSRALDSLDKLVTSVESFFHPSNYGIWSLNLTHFVQRLMAEFSKRWKDEQQPYCKTPVTRRLTPEIRRNFILTLRTPVLLSMFSKDPFTISYSQAAMRAMALLEPNLVMPEILERAYSGLEVVNETHRTTAVMTMLSAVSLPLVTEKLYLGGQKHVVPLLELCIPGIDLNDPVKTICATMFISSVVQHIKIADVSMHQVGVDLSSDAPAEDIMDVDTTQLPAGVDSPIMPTLSREEERALARESTAGFADWVTSLFRRVLALFENLPEEGGKKGTTGGKMEEAVLKAIKGALDTVCLHLSDALFDLVLKLVFEYASTNAKSNAVRAFGQLVSCLARVKPEKTIDRFLPFCIAQIQEELKHGASSIRTTSTHEAVPSDTTLHWNMSILRGCFGYGGSTASILKYKDQLLGLMTLLVEKTKSERGYTGTGRLINRILHTAATIYTVNSRYVNPDEWDSPEFNRNLTTQWGKMYDADEAEVTWHVPNHDEIEFVLEILDRIAAPALDKVEALLETAGKWDSVARNDFCRYLHAARSVWGGLPTFLFLGPKEVQNPCLNYEVEVPELLVTPLDVKAGFVLTDPSSPQYQRAIAHRARFGAVVHRAASLLTHQNEGEDHIDAVIAVSRAIDVYLLEYAMTRSNFESLTKAYRQARDSNRVWPKQKENSRVVFLKRAQVYNAGRLYMHALYRRRDSLDDQLIENLIEMSLSQYTRVRRHSQAILHNACGYFVRSTRFTLPYVFRALEKNVDPDRMKGALYVLWNKGTAAYALADLNYHGQYLLSLLECQHQEKPSVQKLIGNVAQDALVYLNEESCHTDAFTEPVPGVLQALEAIKQEFASPVVDEAVLQAAAAKCSARVALKNQRYTETVNALLDIAERPTTHWRYIQFAIRFLYGLLRRDAAPPPALAAFFLRQVISPHATIRVTAQKAVVKVCAHIKIRTFSKSSEQLWLDEWANPLRRDIPIGDPEEFLRQHGQPGYPSEQQGDLRVDKFETGFLMWTPTVKGYQAVPAGPSAFSWEEASIPTLRAMSEVMDQNNFFTVLALLWGQESMKNSATPELRAENVTFMKSIAKMFEHEKLSTILDTIDPLLADGDRYKQRSGAELLAGLSRGAKHWPRQHADHLWSWITARLDRIHAQMKPDTISFWENLLSEQLVDRDPRRTEPLVKWILSLPLDFHGDSAFAMSKSLSIFNILVDCLDLRFLSLADQYINLFLDNANTGYAEIRSQIAQNIYAIITIQWRPVYSSAIEFMSACATSADPLRIREARYINRIAEIVSQLPVWKEQRLPPPRVSQSQYDKVGLTVLQWVWDLAHGPQAPLVFPYVIVLLPEIIRMSELNDSSELQTYSSAVLYVLSAVTPPPEYIEVIADNFINAIKSSTSWRIRVNALPTLIVFFYRNLLSMSGALVSRLMNVLQECLSDENIEVREMASKMLSGVVRCSQRQSIVPLKDRFVNTLHRTKLPNRRDPSYADSLRSLHSAILGLCALVESFPYSVEPWMPPLTEVLANHATDPVPISTTIRKCASEFKKTHQDTWHKDQLAFNEDQLQSLSTMLVGTSYYA